MDEEIAKWIIEFLIRQNIDDRIINALIGALTLPKDDVRLGKALLLRRIGSEATDGSVSEAMLEAFEMVEELEHAEGKGALESMKSAYCAVAVDCTVRFLDEEMENNDKYVAVAKRIWKEKVGKMEKAKFGLVSESLLRWKQDILSAVLESDVRSRILLINTRKEALKAVNGYLTEAWRNIGPSFLELVAKNRHKTEEAGEVVSGGKTSWQIVVYNGQAGRHEAAVTPNVNGDEVDGKISLPGDDHAIRNEGTQRSQSSVRHKNAARRSRLMLRSPRKPKITDDGCPYPLEFFRMQVKGCASRLEELQTVEKVAAEKGAEYSNVQSTRVNSSMDADINVDRDEVQKRNGDNATHTQNNPSKASLMERNSTARTYRWEDSAEDSLGASPSKYRLPDESGDACAIHQRLRSPKKRRVKKRWSKLEEYALRDGVVKYGKGNWKVILDAFRDVFEERTEVDLKDKWRNLTK